MGDFRYICAVAFGLLFSLASQAVAGNWVFEESTDPSDGRKGVIIYKSPHFDTTPGAFARFIVLDDSTLNFRLRNDADGPIDDNISLFFRFPADDDRFGYSIYNPNTEAKADGCVAEWNTATACRLSCARSYEDFGLGDEVACTTKSDKNLWIDFRTVLTPGHTEHILENYATIDAISFYGGSDAFWFINSDDLLKHICEQTKARDHACRGEMNVAEASEPDKQVSSKDWEYRNGSYVSIDQDVAAPEISISGYNGRFSIELNFIAPSDFGELQWFGLSAVDENGDITSPTFELLKHDYVSDWDEFLDYDYEYYENICIRPGPNKLYPAVCSSTCGDSDDHELDCARVLIGQRVHISISDLDETDFQALIKQLRVVDQLIVKRSGDGHYYWNVGNLPDLLEQHGMPEEP